MKKCIATLIGALALASCDAPTAETLMVLGPDTTLAHPDVSAQQGVYRRQLGASTLTPSQHADSLTRALETAGISIGELWYPGKQSGALCGSRETGAIVARLSAPDDRIFNHRFDTTTPDFCGYVSLLHFTVVRR